MQSPGRGYYRLPVVVAVDRGGAHTLAIAISEFCSSKGSPVP